MTLKKTCQIHKCTVDQIELFFLLHRQRQGRCVSTPAKSNRPQVKQHKNSLISFGLNTFCSLRKKEPPKSNKKYTEQCIQTFITLLSHIYYLVRWNVMDQPVSEYSGGGENFSSLLCLVKYSCSIKACFMKAEKSRQILNLLEAPWAIGSASVACLPNVIQQHLRIRILLAWKSLKLFEGLVDEKRHWQGHAMHIRLYLIWE